MAAFLQVRENDKPNIKSPEPIVVLYILFATTEYSTDFGSIPHMCTGRESCVAPREKKICSALFISTEILKKNSFT
jgi:hypothetical protein